jgi:hypothetical protein
MSINATAEESKGKDKRGLHDITKQTLSDMLHSVKGKPALEIARSLNKMALAQLSKGKIPNQYIANVSAPEIEAKDANSNTNNIHGAYRTINNNIISKSLGPTTLSSSSSKVLHPPAHPSGGAIDEQIDGTIICNCRKSQCLKLYCQCFAAKIICSHSCRCLSCANTADNVIGIQDALRKVCKYEYDIKFYDVIYTNPYLIYNKRFWIVILLHSILNSSLVIMNKVPILFTKQAVDVESQCV